MRRRAFISGLAGSAVAWPIALRAQQSERVRRIGVLMNVAADDAEGQAHLAAFRQILQQLGWSDGSNVSIDARWAKNDIDLDRKYAAELVSLEPDVILASGSPSVAALQHASRTLPIVFVRVSDPVAAGFVDTLARPGGNITGFMQFEYSFSGKWLELLKQIAPWLTRAAVLRSTTNPAGVGEYAAIQSVAPSLGVELRSVDTRSADEIERVIAAFARSPNGGLVVAPSASGVANRELIIAVAARYKLPAIYADRSDTTAGGLVSYGPNRIDQFRRAASYVDRILKGEKPANMPVQAPTKYELVVNLKTAKTLGLTIPHSLLVTADELIE
jgi:putative tryptophan/tyrosine transport system substrate-binding protein